MYKKPRGTVDIYGEYADIFFSFILFLEDISKNFGYSRIETPIFESEELFTRRKDDTSDMITKEMYSFLDKGDRKLVLRPEGTAPVTRFVVEEKILYKEKHPLRYYYIGPMFRYERPQNGRQRQFYQYGLECISIDNIYEETDIIILANSIIEKLNIKNTILKLNYIGNFETRIKWIEKLNEYFSKNSIELTKDSISRINKNPLRILDDKIDGKKNVVINSPKINDFLSDSETEYIKKFEKILISNGIKFEWDNCLVRGLDYYTGIVFEIVSIDNDYTIIGGGKYEKIFSEIGEKDYSCFGFAIGVERIIPIIDKNSLEKYYQKNNIYFANLCDDFLSSNKIINSLRNNNYSIITNYSTNKLKNHFKYSEKYNPKIILIYGNNEKENSEIIIKNQITKNENKVNINNLEKEINKIIGR